MKTKTIGNTTYIVTKYYKDEDGTLKVTHSQWSRAETAFNDRDRHRAIYGVEMAYVFKAKQCIKEE